jgi:hypothetical protein
MSVPSVAAPAIVSPVAAISRQAGLISHSGFSSSPEKKMKIRFQFRDAEAASSLACCEKIGGAGGFVGWLTVVSGGLKARHSGDGARI